MRSAFYESDITPPLGCNIPGYFNQRLGSDVKDRLYAKAVVIENDDKTVAILAIDTCGLTVETCDEITGRIEKFIGLKPENVMITANHTHTGGPLILSANTILSGEPNDDSDGLYIRMMRRLAADAVILAYKRLKNARVSYATGTVDNISFNRNYIMKDGTIRTNPGRQNPDIVKPFAGIDPQLSVLYFVNDNKRPIGAIVNFACHQDCVDGTEYTGDYSSILAKELKKQYGEEFVSVFVSGTCGNINHFDVSKESDAPDHYVMMGQTIAKEAIKAIAAAQNIPDTQVKVEKKNFMIKKRIPSDEEMADAEDAIANIKMEEGVKLASDASPDQFRLAMSKRLMAYVKDPNKEYEITLQVIKLGDCMIYALPCEVFVQFGLYIKQNSLTDKNILATLCNGHRGYIPVKELFVPTVYEAKLGASSYLEKDAGYVISDELLNMAKNLK